MDMWTLFTSNLIVLSHNDHNDTTHWRRWEPKEKLPPSYTSKYGQLCYGYYICSGTFENLYRSALININIIDIVQHVLNLVRGHDWFRSASYWLAKTLEDESPFKSSKFVCPPGKVHAVTTKELQPAHSVLNNHWMTLTDVLTRSLVILCVPICMFRYLGPWNNIAWVMPERSLIYVACIFYMGILHVSDFGKIGLKGVGWGCLKGYL